MHDDRDLVPVATFDHLSEAEVARSLLTADGITAMLNDEPLASMLSPVMMANGGFTLLVSADDAGRAREVLTRPDSTEAPVDPEPSVDGL